MKWAWTLLLAATAGAAAPPSPPPPGDALRELPGLEGVRTRRYGEVLVLEGTVTRESDRELADSVAKASPGVEAVVNRLEVSVSLGDRVRAWKEASMGRTTRLLSALPLLLLAALLVWASWLLGRGLARRYSRRALQGSHPRNPFLVGLASQAIQFGLALVGLLVALQLLDAVALAGAVVGSAGVVGIALGFAFRDLAENYVASILLSLRQPFSPDDHVVIDGNEGVVVGLNSRATLLMTPDGNHLRLPNALVFKAVILNYTRNGLRRFDFVLSLAPDADADIALSQGLEALAGIEGVLVDPAPFAQLQAADSEWLDVQYFAWCDQRRANFGWLRSEGMRHVRARLASLGIEFQRPTLRLRQVGAPPPAPARADVASPATPAPGHGQLADVVAEAREDMGSRDLLASSAPKE